ncbi:MAG: PH domain-containing protein [Methylovirgula sp.]
MSYVKHILQPGEDVLAIGRLHWIIYWHALVWFLACAVSGAVAVHYHETNYRWLIAIAVTALLFLFGLIALIRAWWHAFTTEIAVTTHRVIYKRGFINRHTDEMNIDKIESVIVDQSILGRILGYGTIDIRGTGAGMERLKRIAQAIELRNAITSR